jgi:DNA-binding MarR family transcriptional regulator
MEKIMSLTEEQQYKIAKIAKKLEQQRKQLILHNIERHQDARIRRLLSELIGPEYDL